MGRHLDYKQEITDDAYAQAKAECVFGERLYEILIAHQKGINPVGRTPGGIPAGNVGDLNPAMSRLYNLIWSAALPLNDKNQKKKQREMEAIA